MADAGGRPVTVSAHDVAAELRRRLPGVGVLKLHKLLYYAQGWHLTWAGEPLFEERIRAWANGPVVADLWADEKHDRGRPPPRRLGASEIETIDYVIGRYGRFTGKELIRRTHAEDPWRDASEADDGLAVADPEIGHKELRRWFELDEEEVAHQAKVRELRSRADVYTFDPSPVSAGLDAAVTRAVDGQRVRQTRP